MGKTYRTAGNGRRVRENTRRMLREERTEEAPGFPGDRLGQAMAQSVPAYARPGFDVSETCEPFELGKDFSLFLEVE